ncbi:DUF2975 domain-containing protein [Dyella terrae]|nr:DUF2975 domain-containing protein [Dyella terrae]TBR40538.1 hypothetical protein EYV96_10415 [Dyella terrae]
MARALARAAWVGAAACAVITLWGMLGANGAGPVAATLATDGLPRGWAAAIAAVIALCTCFALIELARALGCVREDTLFSATVTRHFRRFATLLMVAALVRLLLPAAVTVGLAMASGADGARLHFDGDDLVALLPIAAFFFVARLLDQAARLEEDHRSIV